MKLKKYYKTLTKTSLFSIILGIGIFFISIPLITISFSLLVLILFERQLKIKIPLNVSATFVFFIIFSLVLGSKYDFYEKYLWWDDVIHFFYGFGFAFIGYIIIQIISIKRGIKNELFIIILFSFCFSVAFGAIWEIYEYSMDSIFGFNMQRTEIGNGVTDTMRDIILETSAAIITNIYIYLYLKFGQNNRIAKFTKQFKKVNKCKSKKIKIK